MSTKNRKWQDTEIQTDKKDMAVLHDYSDSDSSGCMSFSSKSYIPISWKPSVLFCLDSYLAQPELQILQLTLLNDQMTVIVEVFHDVVMSFFVVFKDDRFHGRVAFDQNTCRVEY